MAIRYAEDDQGNLTAWREAEDDSGNKEWFQVDMPDFDVGKAASNIPKDAVAYGKEVANTFLNPLDTLMGISNLVSGYAGKVIPGEQESEKYADATNQYFAERYGSMDKYKRYAENEPVHAFTDITTLAAPARALPGVAGKAAGAVSALDPFNVAVKGTGAGLRAFVNSPLNISDMFMKSTVKFPPASIKDRKKRADMYETMYENKLTATPEGVERMDNLLGDYRETVKTKVTDLDNTYIYGVDVDHIDNVVGDLIQSRSGGTGSIADRGRDVAAIKSVYDKWKADLPENGRMKPSDLLELKRNMYDEINYSPTKSTSYNPREEAQVAIGRAAKEILEDLNPELKPINEKWGKMLDLKNPMTQATNRLENRNNVLGMGTLIGTATGGAVGGYLGAPGTGAMLGALASNQMTPSRIQKFAQASETLGRNLNKNIGVADKATGGLFSNKSLYDALVDMQRLTTETQPYTQE